LQAFVNNLANGYSKLSDLISTESVTNRSTITQEHNATRDHITSRFQDMQLRSFTKQQCEKFLGSLYYSEIHERQEQISNAHKKTFDFIFDRTGQAVRPWGNFVEWLEKGAGVYWINGKAGSGKSTLMNYVATDSRSMDSLRVWGQASQVLILTFFFWNAGTNLQKSSLGLLRSLLHQLLRGHQEVIPELARFHDIPDFDAPMPVWTRKRLESSLKFVVNKISQPVCLFIDGLDEFDEGEEDLLELTSALQSRPSVKICVSSRPSQCFMSAFESSAQLKLQDLTRRAIKMYVDDRLHADPRMEQLLQEDSRRGKCLIGDVITKADGVFLWVELAVKHLLKGLTNKDDWETMERRLDLLPKGIENLYIVMWSRLGEDQQLYRKEAALYFRLTLEKELSLLHFLIATNENLQSVLLDFTSNPPSTEEVISMCEKAKVRVLTRCAGLLEVGHSDEDETDEGETDEDETDEDETDEDETDEDETDEDETDEDETDEDEADGDGTDGDEADEDEADHEESDPDQANQSQTEEDPRLACINEQTRVHFIHRTARDFLLDTREGQIILGGYAPPVASASYAFIISRIGLARLLPKTSPVGLLRVLCELREAQIAENDALEPLMDAVESYCSAKYSGVSTAPNWLDTCGLIESERGPAIDFLGLAAVQGACLDMSTKFLQHPQRTDPRFTTYLLSCAVYHSDSIYSLRKELVLMLLSDGADPNTTVPLTQFLKVGTSISCWNHVLFRIWNHRYAWPNNPIETIKFYGLIEAFLNNGADLHEKVKFDGSRDFDTMFDWIWGGTANWTLVYEISARYILTELLCHDPHFSKIEKRFESADAETSRRVLVAHHEGAIYSKPISEQDSQYLLEAIDSYHKLGSKDDVDELWNRIGEVSTRDPGDECHCRECTRRYVALTTLPR
jgi:hypothetical protein